MNRNTCTICLKDFNRRELKKTKRNGCDRCSNTLHKECMIEYLSRNNTKCFVCKRGKLLFTEKPKKHKRKRKCRCSRNFQRCMNKTCNILFAFYIFSTFFTICSMIFKAALFINGQDPHFDKLDLFFLHGFYGMAIILVTLLCIKILFCSRNQ